MVKISFNKKQVIALSLVLVVVVAGYLQYSYRDAGASVSSNTSGGKIGEAVYVNGTDVNESLSLPDGIATQGQTSTTGQSDDFFANVKLDREVLRAKDREALSEIANDVNASADIRANAYEEMMKIIKDGERETKIETLLKEKGYSKVAVIFGDDGSVDVVVKAPNLTQNQVMQIADIAARQAGVSVDKIHVKNIY